jgi:hypothetical protein
VQFKEQEMDALVAHCNKLQPSDVDDAKTLTSITTPSKESHAATLTSNTPIRDLTSSAKKAVTSVARLQDERDAAIEALHKVRHTHCLPPSMCPVL